MDQLMTEVWLLTGVTGSEPGLLTHSGGRVSLKKADDSGDKLVDVFNLELGEISEVNWPKLQMSGGCSLVACGNKYRLSFMRPQNTRAGFIGDINGMASISGGRKAGKAWKAILPG